MPVTRLFAARDDGGDRRAVAELILGIVLRTDVVAPRGDALHAHRSGRNAAVDDCHAHGAVSVAASACVRTTVSAVRARSSSTSAACAAEARSARANSRARNLLMGAQSILPLIATLEYAYRAIPALFPSCLRPRREYGRYCRSLRAYSWSYRWCRWWGCRACCSPFFREIVPSVSAPTRLPRVIFSAITSSACV